MSGSDLQPRRPGRGLVWGVALAQVVIYLLLMWHGGWQWDRGGVLGFGMPQSSSVERFGAPVPARLEAGEWQRLLLSPLLHRTLIGALLLIWFWTSIGRRLCDLFGAHRAGLIAVLGGAGGATAHMLAHSGSTMVGAPGPFDAIMAGVGASLLWSLCNRGPVAKAVFRSTLVTLLVIAALTWYFTRDVPDTAQAREVIGREAAFGSFGIGMLAILALGPRRVNGPAPTVVKGLAWLVLAAVVASVAIQAPKALGSSGRGQALAFLEQLEQTEYEAWLISRAPREATDADREDLGRRLADLLAHDFIDGHEGEETLRRYVDTLRAYAQPNIPMPWITEGNCRAAFAEWFNGFERPLREDKGLRERIAARHYWERR